MTIKAPLWLVVGMSALTVSVPAVGEAAVTAWGPATTIADDADVSTVGTLVYAFNLASENSTMVNGVAFSAFPVTFDHSSVTVGDVTVRETMGPMWPFSYGGSTAAPYTALSADYQALLNDFVAAGVVESIEVTLGGLTIGQEYQIQAWSNISSNGSWPSGSSTEGPNLVTLDSGARDLRSNTTDTAGGLGQYSLGTFVADSTSQIFTVSALTGSVSVGPFNSPLPALNAFQLRAVPEPSSIALIAISALPLLCRRRG